MADALNPESDDQQLLAQVIAHYQAAFKANAEPQNYLLKRGISSAEAVDRFRIGFADYSLANCLPSHSRKAGKTLRGRLTALGLLRSSSHQTFKGCLTFPITAADGSGRIVDVYGRRLSKGLNPNSPRHRYLTAERCGVWNIEAFAATDEIILCPSLFDALTFWNAGYRHTSCTFGPDALTDDHLAAFNEFKIRRVLLMVEALAPQLLAAGIDCYLLRFPLGVDANQHVRKASDPGAVLGAILRSAEWLGKGQAPAPVVVEQQPAPPGIVEPEAKAEQVSKPEPSAEPEPQPARTASPLPAAPAEIEAEINGEEVVMQIGHRRYRVRGLAKNLSFDQLKINLLASTERGLFVDTFDLYSARHRRAFIQQAAVELGIEEQTIKKDLGRVLLKLEELQDDQIAQALEPQVSVATMTVEEEEAALQLLRDPQLLDRIVADFDVVGETTNKLAGYLAAVSRKLDQPLAVIIQSSSAAGKTSLMEAVLAFVPPEEQVKYSAMTGQSLFYMGETNLKHKILAIVEEEGAQRASYALKLLQSEGELMIASTGKEPSSGRLVTQEYRVEGPVMIFLTTTAIKIDEELLNRCLVLSVDEDREQTRAIHQLQRHRQTLAGMLASQDRQQTLVLHRNAQRLLKPLLVANPFAEALGFLDDKTRTRRDHLKYLALIRAVTLLHQYQRPVKTVEHRGRHVEYIEVAPEDIAVANRLACEVLGRSVDELPPQTRRLLGLIDAMTADACRRQGIDRADYRFSRREVRERTGWGHTQLKIHLKRLEELEYLLIHRGGRGQSFVYELLYEPPADGGGKFLARLIDPKQLQRSGAEGQKSGRGRGQVGAKSAPSRAPEIVVSPAAPCASSGHEEK